MIAALHLASDSDPEVRIALRWRRVLEAMQELVGSPGYAAWVMQCEAAGGFEKQASNEEIAAAIQSLPSAFAASMLPKAKAALDRNDMDAAVGIVSLLQSAGSSNAASATLSPLLDRLEDALDVDCRELDRELRDKLRTNRESPQYFYAANLEETEKGAAFYTSRIDDPLRRFCTLAKDDPHRLARCVPGAEKCSRWWHSVGSGRANSSGPRKHCWRRWS